MGHQIVAYAWEFWLFYHMLRRFGKEHFDLGVKSTYGSYRWPSFLWYFSKVFHVDPLSGGGRFPIRFRRFFSPKAQRHELFRLFLQQAAFFDPFVLLTLFKANKLYAGNVATKSILPWFARKKCCVKTDFLQVNAEDFKMDEARRSVSVDPRTLKIFYTGKLLEWKGITVILEALCLLPAHVSYEFTIMGNGPARQLYADHAHREKLNVLFIDPQTVPRCNLSYYFCSHDLFAFPTLHGEAGFAPVEAKLHGMELLTLDFSGLGFALTESDICIRTEGKDCEAVVQAMAASIEEKYYRLKCHAVNDHEPSRCHHS
jgi:glycosyltransferase involved in cell wall biosynthesis